MSRSSLFRGGLNDFSMPRCANPACGKFMVGVRYTVIIKDEKVKVCSFACEEALRVKHNDPRKPLKSKPGKPPLKMVDGRLVAIGEGVEK